MKSACKVKTYLTYHSMVGNALGKEGLNMTDLKVLVAIETRDQVEFAGIRSSDLVNILDMDLGWVYRSVRKLVSNGFLERSDYGNLNLSVKATMLLVKFKNWFD